MKHRGRLVIVAALLLTLFALFAPARPAQASACEVASGTGSIGPITLDPTHSYTVIIWASGPGGSISLSVKLSPGASVFPFLWLPPEVSWSLMDNSIDCSNTSFTDGRINKFVQDTNQTAAIYCLPSRIEIYTTTGQILFRVTRGELNRFTPKPQAQLIKQKNGVRLYMLSTGELQLNAPPLEKGKPDYTFTFQDCA